MLNSTNPFDDLKKVLESLYVDDLESKNVRIDTNRLQRTGIPETIFAQFKAPDIIIESTIRLVETNGRVLIYKCPKETIEKIEQEFSKTYNVTVEDLAHAVVVSKKGVVPKIIGGKVGILSGGSSDIPVATEAALMATEMGAIVNTFWDVGVAGLHKLVKPLTQLVENGTHAIIVSGGMDAALFVVVCGLVKIPVIGLPTSVGYGYAGNGISALSTMLQSCAPGGAVVNIDNGIGAGAIAARIANQAIRG